MDAYPNLNTLYLSPRLQARLADAAGYPVTTIVAPTGYGKTTAAQYLQRRIAAEAPDARVFRQFLSGGGRQEFWAGLCRALHTAPQLSAQLLALGYPDSPHTRQQLQVHLLLLSRNQIFSEAQKLRLGSRLLELSAADLRLTQEELAQYAGLCGLPLPERESQALLSVSEGWIAMVYLIFRAYAQTGTWRFDTKGMDTLIEQVMFEPLPERQRLFLLDNCMAEDFSAAQAAFVWQAPDADVLLHDLTHNNAFITESTPGVYRYHHMLRQLLRRKFALLPQSAQTDACRRLGSWYERTGEYLTAAEFFRQAGDWDGLLRTAAADCGKSIGGEHRQMLLSWCRSCPEDALRRHPDAVCVLMRKLFSFREIPELMRLRAILLDALQPGGAFPERERENYLGECDLVMSFLRYNDIAAMSVLHRSACKRMTRTTRCIDLGGTWTFGSPSILMMFHRAPGQLDEENAQMRACMPYYYQVTDGHGSGAEHSMQCETDLLRGKLTEAEIGCHLSRDAALARGQYSILLTAEFTPFGWHSSAAMRRTQDLNDSGRH